MTDDGRADARMAADTFVGRERELAELGRLSRARRAVTLSGPGGVGKTRLLRRLMADLAPDCPDGTFFIDLADLRQVELLAARVAAAAGVSEEPGVPPLDTLTEALRGRRVLLVLDHCDHLAVACTDVSQRLRSSSGGLLVLAASREPMPANGGITWPVPPLALPPPLPTAEIARPGGPGSFDAPARGDEVAPPARGDEVALLARGDAVALFADRAAAAAPGFVLNSRNCAVIAEICRALAGLPLAIELAAAWARDLTADQIAGQLADRCEAGHVAAGNVAAGPPPDRALRAVVDLSYGRLSRAEQVLLRRLSVLAGWSLELAERVCADDGLPATQIVALLDGLARTSLIVAEPGSAAQRRYRMPGPVREYAAARLAQAGETMPLCRRLRDYALNVSEYFFSIGLAMVPAPWTARAQVFRRFDAEADNIHAALAWCLAHGDIEAGLRLCTAFGPSWLMLGALTESAYWFCAFLTADQSGVPGSVRGPALAAGAHHAIGGDDQKLAESWAAEGLELCRAAGNLRFMSAALNLLAQAVLRDGRAEEALRYAGEAVEQARACGDQWNEGYALGGYAAAQAATGQLPEARASAEAGLTLLLEIDHQWGAARTALGLAELCRGTGDLPAAREHYRTALNLLRQVAGDPDIARCLAGLGRVALDEGDLAEARACLAEGLEQSRRTGSRAGISRGLLDFAALAFREGQPDRAVQLAAAVTALSEAARPAVSRPARVQRFLDAAAGLGPAEVARLWAAGLELSPSAAADLALEPPGPPDAPPPALPRPRPHAEPRPAPAADPSRAAPRVPGPRPSGADVRPAGDSH
jgi:predicted ATPase/tetratricopeptide (TPR) repeat protein